jgi:signal transduction histidine kinase
MIAIQSESPRLSELITSYDEIPPQMIVSMTADLFFTSPKTEAVALTEFGEPVGLVTRSKLFASLSRRFGFELYSKKPIIKIAEPAPLIISEDERLEDALQKALQRPAGDIYDELVVVNKSGCFSGLLSVKQMVIQQSHILANSIVQKELAHERAIELEKINSIKSQFITHVTHELRSPINAMIGMAELMKISCEKGYLNQVEDRLTLLMSNAVNLRAIITNILDLSKIEAGKMEVIYERFDIVKILREVAETARMLIGGKPIEVEVISHEGPIIIESDPVKVRQIVMNLVSNAAKFTENGGIRLSAGIEDNHLTIAVSDTGIGIKSEDTGKLFIAFSQLEDAMTKRHEGTGLGLTITKNLLDLLGGKISLSSIFGRGSTFTVSLPTSKQGATA